MPYLRAVDFEADIFYPLFDFCRRHSGSAVGYVEPDAVISRAKRQVERAGAGGLNAVRSGKILLNTHSLKLIVEIDYFAEATISPATLYITIPANMPRPEAKRIFQFFISLPRNSVID